MFRGQLRQDQWVLDQIVASNKYDTCFGHYFVDIGAHDGKDMSNTYVLEKEFGWDGVCVEPQTEVFHQLKSNRSCHCINLCCYSSEGTVPFEISEQHSMLSGINHTCRAPVYKKAKTIDQILHEVNAPKSIAYMNIDTEGSEPEVLKGLTQYDVFCFTIEHNGNNERASWIAAWLSERGYLFRFVEWDLWAIKDSYEG